MSIAKENLDALLATQLFFVESLDTQLSDIIATLVVVIGVNIALRHLCYIAQHMSGIRILILTDAAFLNIEPGKAEHLLAEDAELTFCKFRKK